MARRWSLANQLLGLQLVIVLLVLAGVAAASLAQSAARFEESAGRRAQSVAETLAANGTLRQALEDESRQDVDGDSELAAPQTVLVRTLAESTRAVSGSSSVAVVDRSGTVVASAVPDELGRPLDLPGDVLRAGRSWVGSLDDPPGPRVVAQVPVLSDDPGRVGEVVGLVAVSRDRPTLLDNLGDAVPNLLVYLGVASALGVVGSLLVARRVKRQTLGLEPLEIAGLVEHRDALLHGIKEGIVALDTSGTVTLANDVARELLALPADGVGRSVDDLDLEPAVRELLLHDEPGTDVPVAVGPRVLVLNRMPVVSHGRRIGSVTTLRDRTELLRLQHDLDKVHDVTQTLRAQAHEFSNRLHTISGLIELGEYDEVVGYVDHVSRRDAALTEAVTSRIADPAVAALLIAKASLAAEQGVELQVSSASAMSAVDRVLSADVATVLGNLVDNALDAVSSMPRAGRGRIDVEVRQDDEAVTVRVADTGPGIDPEVAGRLFERGVTTKPDTAGGTRGIGLSLVQVVCRGRGGWVRVEHEGGTAFTARLPLKAAVVAP